MSPKDLLFALIVMTQMNELDIEIIWVNLQGGD